MNELKETKYYRYVKERLGAEVLENEFGFVVYQIKNEECFLVEMFIEEQFRFSGKAGFLISELSEIAHGLNAKFLTANIFLADKGASSTLAAALCIGFKVGVANGNVIGIFKKIGGG